MQTKASAVVQDTRPSLPGEPRPERSGAAGVGSASEDFHQAVYEHQALLMSRALRLTHDKDEAQDLVQDTLVKAMHGLGRFQTGTNMRAWLMRIMVNLFLDRCRQQACRPPAVPLGDDLPGDWARDDDDDPQPLSAQVTFDQLRLAMEQLDPLFRKVYELRVTHQRSYEQISQELQIPVGTVGTRLSRARERLCRLLTPGGKVNR